MLTTFKKAHRLDEDKCYTPQEISDVMEEAILICSSDQDNDKEHWYLTAAGQFIRMTGMDLDRCYVLSEDEARDMLDGFIEDDRFSRLFPEWTEEDQQKAACFGWSLAYGHHRVLSIVPNTERNTAFAGPMGQEKALARVEKAAKRSWDISAQEAAISARAMEAIRISSSQL